MAALQASAAAAASASSPTLSAGGPTRGRASYALARTLRTKPGRPDAPAAHSLSCSDKLAQYALLGIQGALLADVLDSVWLDGVVLGPVDASEDGRALLAEVEEALSRRVLRELAREGVKGASMILCSARENGWH